MVSEPQLFLDQHAAQNGNCEDTCGQSGFGLVLVGKAVDGLLVVEKSPLLEVCPSGPFSVDIFGPPIFLFLGRYRGCP